MGDRFMTKEQWWAYAERMQDELIEFIRVYYPNSCRKSDVCDPVLLAKMYIADRDQRLIYILNETWTGVPESRFVKCTPGFGVVFSLCSESDILYED